MNNAYGIAVDYPLSCWCWNNTIAPSHHSNACLVYIPANYPIFFRRPRIRHYRCPCAYYSNTSASFHLLLLVLARIKSCIGINGTALNWFTSYLNNRSQRVSLNGFTSDSFKLPYGVPQGSCQGPLLFTIYSSKLFEVIKYHLPEAHAYADDTQLYLSFSPDTATNQTDAVIAMERCISDIRKWMLKDKLKLNDDKTEFMLIGTKQQLSKVNIDCLTVGSIDVAPVTVARNLGT